jgi:hypothetical protein
MYDQAKDADALVQVFALLFVPFRTAAGIEVERSDAALRELRGEALEERFLLVVCQELCNLLPQYLVPYTLLFERHLPF